MKERVAYEDAVDLLDADHKAVKKMFIDHAALCAGGAPDAERHRLAQRIAQALGVHAQIEEEIFYPEVRKALGDDALIDEALQEHAEAKALAARIEGMKPADAGLKHDKVKPSWIVSHERPLADAPAAYASFDQREAGWTKVVLKPGKPGQSSRH